MSREVDALAKAVSSGVPLKYIKIYFPLCKKLFAQLLHKNSLVC